MDIETLQKQNADLLLALRQLSDAARPFTCGSIVDETSGTIPLMGKLGEVLAHADSLAADTRPAANAGDLSSCEAQQLQEFITARALGTPAAADAPRLTLQQVADHIGEAKILTEKEFRLFLNGDCVAMGQDDIVALAHLFARPTATSAAGRADWKRFALAVLIDARDNLGSDVDGGMIQDCATECGLLVKVSAQEPCGPFCACDESGDFPQDCYRYSDETRKAIAEQNDTRPAKGAAGLEGGAA